MNFFTTFTFMLSVYAVFTTINVVNAEKLVKRQNSQCGSSVTCTWRSFRCSRDSHCSSQAQLPYCCQRTVDSGIPVVNRCCTAGAASTNATTTGTTSTATSTGVTSNGTATTASSVTTSGTTTTAPTGSTTTATTGSTTATATTTGSTTTGAG